MCFLWHNYVYFKKIKYVNLPRLLSVFLCACLGETTTPIGARIWIVSCV